MPSEPGTSSLASDWLRDDAVRTGGHKFFGSD